MPAALPLGTAQQKQADQVMSLHREVAALHQKGQAREALAKAKQALALCQQVYGPEHPGTAASLSWIGSLLQALGEYAAARPYFEQALAIDRKVLGAEHPDTATSLNNLGLLLRVMGEPAAARPYYEQALAISQKVLGAEHPQTATSLNNLGALLQTRGEHAAARPYFEQALAIRRKVLGAKHPDTATSLNNLGVLLQALGEHAAARPYYEQALALRQQALGAEHPQTAASLNNLGSLLVALGEHAAARPHYEQALAIHKKVRGAEHPQTAASLNNLGSLLQALGEHAAARSYYEQALALHKKVLGPEHPQTVASLNNLGSLLRTMGEYTAARPYHEQALALCKKVFGAEHPQTATSLNNLGSLLVALGAHAEARSYYEQALALRKKVLRAEHPDLAQSLNNLGSLLRSMGAHAQARPYLEQALTLRQKVLGPEHPQTATSLNNLGSLLVALGQPEPAWDLLRQGTAAHALANRKFLTGSAEHDFIFWLTIKRFNFDLLLSLAVQHAELLPAGGHDLMAAVLDWKASAAQALLARQEGLTLTAHPDAQRRYRDLVRVRQQLARLLLHSPGRAGLAQFREQRRQLEEQRDQLERELAQAVDGFAVLQRRQQAGPSDVATRLVPGAVVIELVKYAPFDFQAKDRTKMWGAPRYAAVLLGQSPGEAAPPVVRLVPLGDARSLDATLRTWRAAAQSGPIDPTTERNLRERVWEPLAQALPVGTRRLLLAPDGELALLPFEALLLDDGRYLVEHYQVSYLANGRDLLPRPRPSGHPGPALVLADPDYDALGEVASPPSGTLVTQAEAKRSSDFEKRGGRFAPLPGFAREADAVAAAWRASRPGEAPTLLRRQEAGEDRLAALPRPRLLYLITHGFFLPDLQLLPADRDRLLRNFELVSTGSGRPRLPGAGEDPQLRSGLALAGANQWRQRSERGQSDGLLTAREVQDLDLWGTELVVLSACETGLGEVQVGEGVLGLRRAFQNAGAQTVLASLWKVPDRETEQMMTQFFSRWLKGMPKAQALREAQLELLAALRQDPDPKRRSAPPLYWAGFICHGQPD
jgi:CHAT domain-containing protein/tetratricopeptide (TPR) repeat protein